MNTLKTLIVALGLMLSVSANSSVLTVCNTGGSQYTSLDAAILAGNAGDTLLLKNTNIPYEIIDCDPAWNKAFCVVGIGFNPSITNPKKVMLSYYNACNSTFSNNTFGLSSGGNGSKFYGVEFIVEVVNASSIANYYFEDCAFSARVSLYNFSIYATTFRNCIFKASNSDNVLLPPPALQAFNIAFTNCIFNGSFNGYNNTTSTIAIDHCIFLSSSISPITGLQFATIQNSIFMNSSTISSTTSGCIFNNNIARLAPSMPPSGNSGSGNIVNADPLFVSYSIGNLYSSSDNYALQSGSLAIGAGLGNSDIGIHDNNSTFNEAGEPKFTPMIRNMTIDALNIIQNGNVNVRVRSTKAR